MTSIRFILLFLYSLISLHCFFISCAEEEQVYVVYFGTHEENKTPHEREEMHHSCLSLVKKTEEEARASLVYSYKHIHGFAALLTSNEASQLSELESTVVVSVFKSFPREYSTQTTRSWDFLDLEGMNSEMLLHNFTRLSTRRDMLTEAKYGQNIIVGIIDSGIWPESKSFSDDGISDIPSSWTEGKCIIGEDFDDSNCNRKIIGAKYFHKAFEKYYGVPRHPDNSKSPRDFNGHGTHIASIVSGRTVRNVEAPGGLASGRISGGAPMSRLAIYKVCWQVREEESLVNDCLAADVLAAIDDAILDGIDVMTICIGKPRQVSYADDLIAIGTLYAVRKNIVVVSSAGYRGPYLRTVSNIAPWILTTGSSTIDRMFIAYLKLHNSITIKGQTITAHDETSMHSLVYSEDVETHNVPENLKGACSKGSLYPEKVRGKIVLCQCKTPRLNVKAGAEVLRAGGVGIIIGDISDMGVDLPLYSHQIPAITLGDAYTTKTVISYIRETTNPMASIGRAQTLLGEKPAPSIATFSSKGPSVIDSQILKPDLIAPGLNILAAWSDAASPTKLIDDDRIVKYNIDSGSSIAAAHIAAVVILLKAIHPEWSVAAIKSAIMTSASTTNDKSSSIKNYNDEEATPFAYGSGHLRPTKAVDPGLVYDASFKDYVTYLCNLEEKDFATLMCEGTSTVSLYSLNYPTMAISYTGKTIQLQRTVTNVVEGESTYVFNAVSPNGFLVEATPSTLNFDHVGQKHSFTITVTKKETTMYTPRRASVFGYYSWNDSSHYVRSAIVVNNFS